MLPYLKIRDFDFNYYHTTLSVLDGVIGEYMVIQVLRELPRKNAADLVSASNFVDKRIIDGKTCYLFELPQESREVVNKLIEGKFSEMPSKWKEGMKVVFKVNSTLEMLSLVFIENSLIKKALEEELDVVITSNEVLDKPALEFITTNLD